MSKLDSVVIAIPARWGSKRFEGKLMEDLKGQPVLKHTWERAKGVGCVKEVYVVTDDERIRKAVESWGGRAILSDPQCCNGTDRIASIIDQIEGDYIINVQGDECYIEQNVIEGVVDVFASNEEADLVTPVYRISTTEALFNKNVVKVVCSRQGRALYFSRSAIPFLRDVAQEDWINEHVFYGHVGVYGYTRALLEIYRKMDNSVVGDCERLEQLRFLEAGSYVQTFEVNSAGVAIDDKESLDKARLM